MPSIISNKIKLVVYSYLQERKNNGSDASLYDFVNCHVDLIRDARDLMPNYQVFIRRSFQTKAKELDIKMIESSIIRWRKILDPEAETTVSTLQTVSNSFRSQSIGISDISQWQVSISNKQFIFKRVNIEARFDEYKEQSYSMIINNDPLVTIQEIAAIDNVLYMDNMKDTSQLMKNVFGTSILHDFRINQQSSYKEIKDKFPSDIKDEVEEILDTYTKEKDLFEADKSISLLYSKAENHDVFRIIKFVANLIDEVSEEEIIVSENHLTSSFIHVAMKAIFKKDSRTLPHM